jgi:adenylosuccinate lyase
MVYQSPYSVRYGSEEMRRLWSESSKRRVWRRVWLAVAEAQAAAGLLKEDQVEDIRKHVEEIDLERAYEIEGDISHDLMAELRTFSDQCAVGGGILHWGLTSADIQDNADVIRQKAGIAILLQRLNLLLQSFADRIEAYAGLPVMGYTHLQPAEPTTLGYRLGLYAQDMLHHYDLLVRLHNQLRGKGIRGAVGTSGPFCEMLAGTGTSPDEFEAAVLERLGLQAYPITSQTYPRIQDYELISRLAGLAGSLHKFAFDLRLMQSPPIGLVREPFSESQVGSSAMPFKRNPVKAEKICSLARQVSSCLSIAWENAANALLERTLDDSANRRSMIPEAFLGCDEMLLTAILILDGLIVDEKAAQASLEVYGPFASLERLLTALVKAGADRGEMHERLRLHSLSAWEAIQDGRENPLPDMVAADTTILKYLQPARIQELMDAETYVGLAPGRAAAMAVAIRERSQPAPPRDR